MTLLKIPVFPLLASLLCALPLCAAQPHPFQGEIDAFAQWDAKNTPPADPVLFIGSSSIRMWQTADGFPGLRVINRGFGGSQFSDLLYFYDRIVTPYAPHTVVIYCGDNDIWAGTSPEQVAKEAAELVARIHKDWPKAWIVMLPPKPSPSRAAKWAEYQKAAALMKEAAAADPRQTFVDLATPLLDAEGNTRPQLYREDMLHLNPQGYAIWNKALRPVLDQLTASTAKP